MTVQTLEARLKEETMARVEAKASLELLKEQYDELKKNKETSENEMQ